MHEYRVDGSDLHIEVHAPHLDRDGRGRGMGVIQRGKFEDKEARGRNGAEL